MKKFIKKSFVIILLSLCFLPAVSFAAEMFLSSDKSTYGQGEEFLVQVYLNTEDVSVNAVGGALVFPTDTLELKEIRDGNSAINFWVEKPSGTTNGNITFSGITAGGFTGTKKFLFGAVFKTKASGAGSINFKDIQVLQNDGAGTAVATVASPFTFTISNEAASSPANLKVVDIDPPENFTPFIAHDPSIFNGKYFLVFSAIDKGVGIDHYEVREGIWSDYVVAESPYLLKDQSLRKDIVVKAVDRYGNKRLAKVKAQNPSFNFEKMLIFGIILVICFLIGKKIWSKYARK